MVMLLSAFGAVCFVLALLLIWKRREWRRTQSVLMLVAGLAVSGAVGGLRDAIARWSHDASVSASTKLFGVAVPYVIAFVIVAWWVLDMDLDGLVNRMRGRGGSGRHTVTRLTPWLGLLVPVALAALPGLGGLLDHTRHGVAALAAMIG